MHRSSRAGSRLLLVLVFLSGAAGLIDEVVFTRRFVQIFGSTSWALSTVLAAFMAGFALGAYRWGQAADRKASAIRLYAKLELAIAVSALAIFLVLPRLMPLFQALYDLSSRSFASYTAARFLVLFGLVLVPTTCMGATLPVLARALHGSESRIGSSVGLIYAVNTLGAVFGTVLAGFALIELLGLTATVACASALNVLAALGVLVLLRGGVPAGAAETPVALPDAFDASLRRAALAATFVSGFASLGFEVVWTRILIFYVTGTTYAFTIMLATFLVGIALGSFVFSRGVDFEKRPRAAIAVAQILAALMALLVVWILSALPQGREYPRPEGPTWMAIVAKHFAWSFSVMLLPTVCIGGTFPVACRMAVRSPSSRSRDVGQVYTANTLGAILGSLGAGFLLVPLFGLERSNRILAGALALSASFLLVPVLRGWGRALGLVPAAAFAALLAIVPGRRQLIDLDPGEKLTFYREGSAATVGVVEEASGERRLLIDNIFVAGSHPLMLTDQKSLAHFPCLLHEDPRRVLSVGFGSGGASYSFTLYREVKEVDCVEIVPDVPAAADQFLGANHGILKNPKFRLILDDARSYLSLASGREKYDVIVSDCTDLSYRANADLYQREFFEACRRRLNPGGIMCVWLPLRHLSHEDFGAALGSFLASFPHGTLWYMLNLPSHYVLLLGKAEPLSIDIGRMNERLSRPEIRADLEEIGLADPIRVASCLLLDEKGMARLTEGAPRHTEDHPRLEFTVPRFARGAEREFENIEEMLPNRVSLRAVLPELAGRDPGSVALDDAVAQALIAGHVAALRYDDLPAFRNYGLAVLARPRAPDVRRLLGARRRRYERYAALAATEPRYVRDRASLDLLDGRFAEAAAGFLDASRARSGSPEATECLLGAAVAEREGGAGDGVRLLDEILATRDASAVVVQIARALRDGAPAAPAAGLR
ncbi:MAG: fused MFS/spermidine synthase [Acidobacteriota bacterium]